MLDQIISYYRACYQADLRSINLTNFFGSKVKHHLLLNDAEILEGKMDNYPVSTDWAEAVEKHLAIYSKEQTLYCCAFFVHGKTRMLGKKQEVFAPLYFYPASLEKVNEVDTIQLDLANPILNPSVISSLKSTNEISQSNTYEQLINELPRGAIGFSEAHQIEDRLNKYFPDLDVSALPDYPNIIGEKGIKTIRKNEEEKSNFTLIPAIGLGLMKKSTASRGILTELDEIAKQKDISNVIKSVFFPVSNTKKDKSQQEFMMPVTLSASQEQVFHSSLKNDISLVVGPPGTGKSFTIAALAVEHLTRGKSVLIASKNDQAVHVIVDKIGKDFGLPKVVVNAANRNYKQALQSRLKNLLSGMMPFSDVMKIDYMQDRMRKLNKELSKLRDTAGVREKMELEAGQVLYDAEQGILKENKRTQQYLKSFGMANWKWFEHYFPLESIQKHLKEHQPMWELMFEIGDKKNQQQSCVRDLIAESFNHYLKHGLEKHRETIQILLKALRARTGNKKEGLFDDIEFEKVLDTLPIWTVNTSDIHAVLPLRKELFDLLIIDEATQCDMASVLPLLQRTKHAVIVGDPKQLRHLSFLSREQQDGLIKQHELEDIDKDLLNYREKSILDIVFETIKNQHQVQFLNEHYRSMPDIIRFSNRRFYDDNLTVMTDSPSARQQKHIFHCPVGGKRYKTGYNKIEAEAVLNEIKEIIESESALEPRFCKSIGVLSPFREQVNYLQRQVSKFLDTEQIEKHRLLIGTPFSFQGEERDIMLLSFVLDNEAHASAFQYLNRPDVFNVSITRARVLQKAYTSFSASNFKFNNLLFNYINSLENLQIGVKNEPVIQKDAFTQEVIEVLKACKLQNIYHPYHIAGVMVDLVVVTADGKTLGIDLVGYPGIHEAVLPMERWQMLERVGVQIFFLPYSRWYYEKERCVDALKDFVGA